MSNGLGYYNVLRSEIEPLLPAAYGRVMDVGCGAGVTSKWLGDRSAAETVGVEANADAARLACGVLDRVIVADIEANTEFIDEYCEKVDLLLLLDILEHLQDPWAFVTKIKRVVTQRGAIIASLPNVRNVKVLLPLLLNGQWRYGASGLLDRTHLRFFTKKTMIDLFEGADLVVDAIVPTGPLRIDRVKSAAGSLAFAANKLALGAFTEFFAHQYLVRARRRR